MKLVKLSTSCAVNPEFVASVRILPNGCDNIGPECVAVHMSDGTIYRIESAYNESIYQTHDRALKKLARPE